MPRLVLVGLFLLLLRLSDAVAGSGEVLSHQKISDTEGGFSGVLDDNDRFGYSVAALGDLNGDGVDDLAVGAFDGGLNGGAVWILFLAGDGTVMSHQKISAAEGGFSGVLEQGDLFGVSLAAPGDLDGDGNCDLAVGAALDDDGSGTNTGAVWILFLHSEGTVKSHRKISDSEGWIAGILNSGDRFGSSIAAIGDLDGDGIGDLAIGAAGDDIGGLGHGAIWILFLNTDGTVKSHQRIDDSQGDLMGLLDDHDVFGYDLAALGDLNGDEIGDLAVGAVGDDDGGPDRGAVWILFLDADGTVISHQKISDAEGGFSGALDDNDQLGRSVVAPGDLDGDGIGDLAVGAFLDDDGGLDRGAVWILMLNADGTVHSHQKISDTEGGFAGVLDDFDLFGISMSAIGDMNHDRIVDLAVGAYIDDDGGTDRGAVWFLFLDGVRPLVLDVTPSALSWSPRPAALGYDVVRGNLGELRSSGGDFALATAECLESMHPTTSFSYSVDPAAGDGFWFLIREVTASGVGTYDSNGPSQDGSRDAETAASGFDCP